MKRRADIRLELTSEEQVKIFLKALSPETKKPATLRSKVSVRHEGKTLIMQIEAEDSSALRAALNSYLRWITVLRDTYNAARALEEEVTRKNT